MLRRASLPNTEVILRHLKQHEDINEAVKYIEADMILDDAVIMAKREIYDLVSLCPCLGEAPK
jgi:hypothetical protein